MAKLIDLTGMEFDNFTVLRKGNGRITKGGQHKTTWICRCVCGKEFEVDAQAIKRNSVKSCGCMRYKNREKIYPDLLGKKFGRLTVVKRIPQEEREKPKKIWMCQCECGNFISLSADKLNRGHTQSCGCLKKEYKKKIGNLNKKYQHTDRRIYGIYRAMISRCYNPKSKAYERYGGRGIMVCNEWRGEFGYDYFYEWSVSNGYKENLTIDRINVNGNYEPENCRWITNQEQQYNKRTNNYAEYNGEIKPLKQWSRELNIPYQKLRYRYFQKKMSIEEILKCND